MIITVEKRNQQGVYANGKWYNYSKFYKGQPLEVGKTYEIKLSTDGKFITAAKEIQPQPANGGGQPQKAPQNWANSPQYLALKLTVELLVGRPDLECKEKVIHHYALLFYRLMAGGKDESLNW